MVRFLGLQRVGTRAALLLIVVRSNGVLSFGLPAAWRDASRQYDALYGTRILPILSSARIRNIDHVRRRYRCVSLSLAERFLT